jgi:ABC-type transport system involved in multi-copper enzyme maturation permease subunit
MDAPQILKPFRFKRWLPYYAVFQEDIRQTLRSWVYRSWVLISVLTGVGYLLYRMGVDREAGIVQHASTWISDLLRWCVFGSVTLIIVLTAGTISAERGTLADSVLSRGISRYQYFLGKWHARLATVLGTFLAIGIVALVSSFFLHHEDLSLPGSLLALLTIASLLAAVISCGVTVSAIFNNTLVAVAVLFILVYGTSFALLLLPGHLPSPYRIINGLPYILRGEYNYALLGRLIAWSASFSALLALIGLGCFARRDV